MFSQDSHRRGFAAAGALVLALLAACESTTEPRSDAERLRISPPLPAVVIGEPVQLTGQIEDVSGRPLPTGSIVWTSSDTTIATIDADGLLHGVRVGETTVTGSAGGLSTQVAVTVTGAPEVAGPLHMCAIASEGALFCWGRGVAGQLGNGTADNAPEPSAVATPPAAFEMVAVGAAHTCAIDLARLPWCWGRGSQGRLGNADLASMLVPDRIADELPYVGLAAGRRHTCSWRPNGRVACWGDNAFGQLGSAGAGAVFTPVDVSLLATHVSAGARHNCAVEQDTSLLFCWGANERGQLGTGDADERTAPTRVQSEAQFARVSGGESHTCAIRVDGLARCWGANSFGQLGNGARADRTAPVVVQGDIAWTRISAGTRHTCAIDAAGAAWCWGANGRGQLGTGGLAASTTPAPVAGGATYSDVFAGNDYTCALTTAGAVHCWGANDYGQLGTGDYSPRPAPTPVASTMTFQRIAQH